jgi:hypothetical protein
MELNELIDMKRTLGGGDMTKKLNLISPQQPDRASQGQPTMAPRQAPMAPRQAPMAPQQASMMQRTPSKEELQNGLQETAMSKLRARAGISDEDVVANTQEIMGINDMLESRSSPPPQGGLPMSAAPAMQQAMANPVAAAQGGGLMQLAAGGEFSGIVPGDGHGMEDNVMMPIKEGPEQVATLAVSPTEYVVDSYTMAALGNGNPNEGAKVMDNVVENVREKAYGTNKQPNEISGLAALRPMMERV